MSISNTQFKNLAKRFGTPLYVYDASVVERQWKLLESAIKYKPHKIYYAQKANSNLHILKLIKKLGAYLDVASPAELYLGLKAGFKPSEMSFTGLNLSEDEIKYVVKHNVIFNADSLSQLERFGKLASGKKVGVRINPVLGAGHHKKVITAGRDSKFGIYYKDVDKIKTIVKKYNLKLVGLHQHIGSGILNADDFLGAVDVMLSVAGQFNNLEYIDFGGGLGIPYKYEAGEKPLDVRFLGRELSKRFEEFAGTYLPAASPNTAQAGGRPLELRLEPGRFLIAQAGTLLAEVTAIKKNPAGDIVIGTNTGMTHMLRYAMYGSFHGIENISNLAGKRQKVTIVGNICESSDVFAKDRMLASVREGDILVLRDIGAYGSSMASRFNGRLLPAEVLVEGKKIKLIRRRDRFEDFLPPR